MSRRGNISSKQKEVLIKFMNTNPKLKLGKFDNSFTIQEGQKLWKNCADKLNAIPGANKDWVHWRKTWQDVKKTYKSKNVKPREEKLMMTKSSPDIQNDNYRSAEMVDFNVMCSQCTSIVDGDKSVSGSDASEKMLLQEYRREKINILKQDLERKLRKDEEDKKFQLDLIETLKTVIDTFK